MVTIIVDCNPGISFYTTYTMSSRLLDSALILILILILQTVLLNKNMIVRGAQLHYNPPHAVLEGPHPCCPVNHQTHPKWHLCTDMIIALSNHSTYLSPALCSLCPVMFPLHVSNFQWHSVSLCSSSGAAAVVVLIFFHISLYWQAVGDVAIHSSAQICLFLFFSLESLCWSHSLYNASLQ